MSAGLPGLGLGGLFFIFSALMAPIPELWRTLRGRSDLAAWRVVGRQFAQAVLMVAVMDLALRFSYLALSETGLGNPPPADSGTVLPLVLIGITSALLSMVVIGAKLAELVGRIRTDKRRVPPRRPVEPAAQALSRSVSKRRRRPRLAIMLMTRRSRSRPGLIVSGYWSRIIDR